MCDNCYDDCAPKTTDRCVSYQGKDVEELGICHGDKLAKVERVLIEKVLSLMDGTGITPKDIQISDYVRNLLNSKEPNLINILQVLLDNTKALKESIDKVNGVDSFTFDKGCLTITGDVTRDKALQAMSNLICSIDKKVKEIPNQYVKNEDLEDKVEEITSGATTQIQYATRLFPNAPTLYIGDLANFDNTGKGIVARGFEKVFILNGLNGTPDWRGRVGVGAIRNVPGGTPDTVVDPANVSNPGTNYAIGEKGGKNYHALTVSEMPKHSHEVSDPGHEHTLSIYRNDTGIARQDNGAYLENDNDAAPISRNTNAVKTGISLKEAGSNLQHENRQPYVAAVWIAFIP